MMRKENQEINIKIFLAQPLGARKRGRPRLRWRDQVDEDARKFGVRNWWMKALDCDEWIGFLE